MRYFMKIRMQSLMVALALAAMISGLVVQPQAFAQERLRNSVVEQTEVPNNPTIGQGSRDDSAAYRAEVEKRSALLQQLRPASVDEDLMLSPPANDNFASATVLTPGVTTGAAPGTNVEATAETGEPNHASASIPIQSVWYNWTSPANLSMTFETAGGTLVDTTMAVYTGSSVSSLTLVAANDEIGLGAGLGTPSRVTFIANSGVTYRIAVDGFSNNVGTFTLRYSINRAETFKQFNYNGDSFSDFAVFRPGNTTWYIDQRSDPPLVRTFGLASDELAAGDYDGDGKTDITVWRPSNGTFYVIKSSTMTLLAERWGSSGDRPVHGDFDGDDISDFAVWRPSNGVFYVRQSSDLSLFAVQWGVGTTDVPATGDYDGDGETDLGVFRFTGSEAGTFYVRRSSDESLLAERWGLGSDLIVPGDYDGDGKNDMAVYRQSNNTFYARRSFDGSLFALAWGQPGDLMAPGDYAGNFNTDVTIFRPSDGRFYVHTSGTGALLVMPWGQSGDVPVANKTVH